MVRPALTTKCVAVAAVTAIGPLAPVMLLVTVSVAVKVWLPAVFSVHVKMPTPAAKCRWAARTLPLSLLDSATVPV